MYCAGFYFFRNNIYLVIYIVPCLLQGEILFKKRRSYSVYNTLFYAFYFVFFASRKPLFYKVFAFSSSIVQLNWGHVLHFCRHCERFPCYVIASEAEQSFLYTDNTIDCFVTPFLAMTMVGRSSRVTGNVFALKPPHPSGTLCHLPLTVEA